MKTKRFRQVVVNVYWGDAGVNKTRRCLYDENDNPLDGVYLMEDAGESWWDGYEGERTLVLDEFYGRIPYGMLLRILDGHQLRLKVKGTFTYAQWTKVEITSNNPPHTWYPQGMTAALKRRLATGETKEIKAPVKKTVDQNFFGPHGQAPIGET